MITQVSRGEVNKNSHLVDNCGKGLLVHIYQCECSVAILAQAILAQVAILLKRGVGTVGSCVATMWNLADVPTSP